MPSMKILTIIFLLIFFFLLYVRFLETTTAFIPSRDFFATPKSHGLDYQDVAIKTEDGVSLHGWWVPSIRIPPSKTTVLFLHGNAGNIGDRTEKIMALNHLGVHVLIIDYRGYGASQGTPSETGLYRDAKAAFDWLRQRPENGDHKIIVYGESLGGAVAIDLATHRSVDGLILDSTFPCAEDVAKIVAPFVPSFLLSMKFDSLQKIENVKVPKLFMHSPADEVIPFALGWKLYEKAPMPKEFVELGGGHNDWYIASGEDIWDAIEKFLKEYEWIPS
ncbi:MAG: alpha/beta hydrolase [Candidatus Omnitrophica bacterium]|nr:alpha/beta hydrolase [Candidatus Omnitrophota bacterium]